MLILICLMMMGDFYCYDNPAALKEQLKTKFADQMSPSEYETNFQLLYSAYAFPNIVLPFFGGYLVGVYRLGFNPSVYLNRTLEFLEFSDVTLGLIKAAVFGFLIALMGCYHGYHSGRGAEGVGRATTNAVVSSSILILIANYIVTALFFG